MVPASSLQKPEGDERITMRICEGREGSRCKGSEVGP